MRKLFQGRSRYFLLAVAVITLVTFDVIMSGGSGSTDKTTAPESFFFDSFNDEIDGYTQASLIRHVSVVRSDYDSLPNPKPHTDVLSRADIKAMVYKAITLDKQYPGNLSVLKSLVDAKGASPRVTIMANLNAYPGFRYTTGDGTDPRVIEAVISYIADSTSAKRISLLLGGSYQSFSGETDVFVKTEFNGVRWNQYYPDLPDDFSLQGMLDTIKARNPGKTIEGINSNYDEILTGGRSYRDLTPAERVGRTPEFYPVPVGKNGIGALTTTNTIADSGKYNPTEAILNCDVFVNVPVMKLGPYDVNINGIFKNYIGSVSRATYSSMPSTYPNSRSVSLNNLDHSYLVGTVMNLFSIRPTDYAVFDAIYSMEGEGSHPYTNATGVVQRNLIVAGKDPVSVEAVGAATMKINPLDVEHLRWAHAKGYGVMDLRRIVIEGMPISAVDTDMVAAIDGQGLRNFPGFANRHYTGRTCRRWLINGMYRGGDNSTAYIDEVNANPVAGDTVNGKSWTAYYSPTHQVELGIPFDAASDSTIVYAFTRIFSDSFKTGILYAGGGRGVKIWLNGVVVSDTNLITYNDASVYKQVYLNPGDNRILVKVRKSGTNFKFSLAIVNSGLESARNSVRMHSSGTSLGSPTTLNADKKKALFGGRSLFGTFYHLGIGQPYDIAVEKGSSVANVQPEMAVSPNPFTPVMTVTFSSGASTGERAAVDVFDLRGRHIAKLFSGRTIGSSQRAVWDGTNTNGVRVAAGQYICRLTTSHGTMSKRVVFLR
ncbi:MAG: DUF362 domain-containing protein [Fibrobacteres bacterium]|nr:DUF362 domain-containing protein [Fibrobacterota bacterium]